MKLRTFHGRTMAEVLSQVKRRFGPDAVILNTRTVKKGGLLGFRGKPYVEITAAERLSDLPAPLRRGTVRRESGWINRAEGAAPQMASSRNMDSEAKLISRPRPTQDAHAASLAESVPRAPLPDGESSPEARPSDALLSEIGALKVLVNDLVRERRSSTSADWSEGLYETYLKLVENSVAEEIARELIEKVRAKLSDDQLGDPKAVRAHLADAVESMLPTAGPIRLLRIGQPTIIALIGPTGVGKTTTVAKLAANLCLREHRKVGLITIDTYRIAAVDQLKTYARIIDVPLEVVMSPRELKDAVGRMADLDVILIDTAGRSQRDAAKIKELVGFFDVVKPDEVHLVLASTCSEKVLTETIRRFRDVGVNRVIFTKLDEAIGFGVILGCVQKADAWLSYVTTGQDVPDDIRVGKGQAMARLILGERSQDADLASPAIQG